MSGLLKKMNEESKKIEDQQAIILKEFFETVPPGKKSFITGLAIEKLSEYGTRYEFELPTLELYCENNTCNGIRLFDPTDEESLTPGKEENLFATYLCRNCQISSKIYALSVFLNKEDRLNGEIFKFGELPAFGPPMPAKVIKLIGPEREYFLKGRRSENQGLGIAAFAYYRRVIENQKNRILDEIIRASEKLGQEKEVIDELKDAKKEPQFSRAVSAIKHGIPQTLLINGHNPLTLLHSALSAGLHAQTDEECLELATSIRIVLIELVERTSNVLKDEAELNKAVNRLLRAKNETSK